MIAPMCMPKHANCTAPPSSSLSPLSCHHAAVPCLPPSSLPPPLQYMSVHDPMDQQSVDRALNRSAFAPDLMDWKLPVIDMSATVRGAKAGDGVQDEGVFIAP